MQDSLRALIADRLEGGRWTSENHQKLVGFIARHSRENPDRPVPRPIAAFDADQTLWDGDLGETVFVHMLRTLRFQPRLPELLPAVIDVPAGGLGLAGAGRLFIRARVEEASAILRETLTLEVSERPAALAGDPRMRNAWRVYAGALLAHYHLLEFHNGPAALDPSRPRRVTGLFTPEILRFYEIEAGAGRQAAQSWGERSADGQIDVYFPTLLGATETQRDRDAAAGFGAYTQLARWQSLDHTPEALQALALETWDTLTSPDSIIELSFPVDAPDATTPAAIDYNAASEDLDAVAFGPDIRTGTISMPYGLRLRPEMVNLLEVMRAHDITPVVVTASQIELVRAIVARNYGIPPEAVQGMECRRVDGRYDGWLLAPVTFGPGKVDAFQLVAERLEAPDARPVFCAGDSNTDFELVAFSTDGRCFFDRGKRPFMSLAEMLMSGEEEERTLRQSPFQ